jgi:hypothetical protein
MAVVIEEKTITSYGRKRPGQGSPWVWFAQVQLCTWSAWHDLLADATRRTISRAATCSLA